MTDDVRASEASARAIAILADLVGFDTVSSNSNMALIRYVEELLVKLGFSCEVLPDPSGEKANIFATIGPDRAHGVILSGHTDVVPVTGQRWTSDPFTLTKKGSRLYGRGTADMKSFIACTLAALEFARLDTLERPIHLAFSYDEEIGCQGAPAMIDRIASSIAFPAVAIVGEPSNQRIIGSHKSVHVFKVSIAGVPAHSSAVHQGISANMLAIRLMNTLMQIADAIAASDQQNTAFKPPFTTLTVGTMQGGTAANILAADAEFVFDMRCLPEHVPEDILSPFYTEVERLRTAHPAATIAVETLAIVPPLTPVPDGEAERLARAVTGDNAAMLAASYGAEAGQFQQAGFPTVICGPGSMDQGHQPDEFIEIAQIEKCMLFLDRLFALMRQPVAVA